MSYLLAKNPVKADGDSPQPCGKENTP